MGIQAQSIPSHGDWHDCTHSVLFPNGIRMAYMELGKEDGAPLVLVHGHSDSSRLWRSMVLDLQNDFHIYAVDLRGFGQSDKPDQYVYTMAEHAGDVIAFMDVCGIEKAFLTGHSMGSMVAQNIAFSRPERIRGLALLSSFARMHETPQQVKDNCNFYRELNIAGMSDVELQKLFVPDADKLFDRTFLDGYLSTLKGVSEKGLSAGWFGMSMADNRNFLQFIEAPTLICWGSKDAIFTEVSQNELRECLPRAKYVIFQDKSHDIPSEIPEQAAREMRDFFLTI